MKRATYSQRPAPSAGQRPVPAAHHQPGASSQAGDAAAGVLEDDDAVEGRAIPTPQPTVVSRVPGTTHIAASPRPVVAPDAPRIRRRR